MFKTIHIEKKLECIIVKRLWKKFHLQPMPKGRNHKRWELLLIIVIFIISYIYFSVTTSTITIYKINELKFELLNQSRFFAIFSLKHG